MGHDAYSFLINSAKKYINTVTCHELYVEELT
jgi:hypothetical protein